MTSTLKQQYDKDVLPLLRKELGRDNLNNLPKLVKVSVNVGIGSRVTQGNKNFSEVQDNISAITGQTPNVRKARISVSNFKLREGMPVGLTTTLRGEKMYDFVARLVNVALPRVRDFRGISINGFDGQGNFCIGLKDITIFPEVSPENLARTHGLQINVCTTATNNREAYVLLKALGFPFKDEVKDKNNS
jgi:large subunit ribosomal protein L5